MHCPAARLEFLIIVLSSCCISGHGSIPLGGESVLVILMCRPCTESSGKSCIKWMVNHYPVAVIIQVLALFLCDSKCICVNNSGTVLAVCV